MDFDSTSTLLATGSADSSVRVWDMNHYHCTHAFKGHGGLVTCVRFHPDIQRLQLFTASEDGNIRVWSLTEKKYLRLFPLFSRANLLRCIGLLESHVSVVRELCFSKDGDTLISAGRDKVLNVWDLRNFTLRSTLPVYEVCLERCVSVC